MLTKTFDLQIGDGRVNEQPLLAVMHSLWLREHNRLAEYVFRNVPNQTDEFYFQHVRRIVIAEMQHIIYNEYFHVIIGTMLFFNELFKSLTEMMCVLCSYSGRTGNVARI